MKEEELFGHFEKLANQLTVTILEGKGDFEGGYCTVNGDQFVVLNKTRPMGQRLRVLARSFAEIKLHEQYMVPALREFIEAHRLETALG
ncbi:MAG: hypothetical protein CMG71_04055 [Candidatus Marinimicrobia bacterium]|nr:hypothetical protein [Candidatus Neomarinimicrobiota bacterium]